MGFGQAEGMFYTQGNGHMRKRLKRILDAAVDIGTEQGDILICFIKDIVNADPQFIMFGKLLRNGDIPNRIGFFATG